MTMKAMNINNDNIEQYIFLYKEGLLDDAGKTEMKQAIAGNDEWQRLANMYDPTLQVPAYPKLTYAGKEKLRSIAQPTTKRQVLFPLWSRVAAACAILVAVVLFIRLNNSTSKQNTIVAINNEETINDTLSDVYNNVSDNTNRPLYLRKSSNKPLSSEVLIAETESESQIEGSCLLFTEDLITFVDDDDTSFNYLVNGYSNPKTTGNQIEFTDQLITFDDDMPSETPTYSIQKPEWRLAINDWFATLQIARLEFQTDVVTNITKRLSRE